MTLFNENGKELVKLYTKNGACIVVKEDYESGKKIILSIHNSRGEHYQDWNTTKKQRDHGILWGVHRNNLFSSLKLAKENHARILADIFK